MAKYNFPVPQSRGLAAPVCDDVSVPDLCANDFFLHLLLGRVALTNGEVVELETIYNAEIGAVDIELPDYALELLENIGIGPNLQRFQKWVNIVAAANVDVSSLSLDSTNLADALEELASGGNLVVHTQTAASYIAGTNNEAVILCDCSLNSITVNLPLAASSTNRMFNIKKIDSSSNNATIDGNGSETIDDSTTQIITAQYDAATIVCDGTEWWII